MLFVKDLGPTAQNIAKRKLLGCEIRTASSAFVPASVLISQNPINKMRSSRGKTNLKIDDGDGEKVEVSLNAEREMGNTTTATHGSHTGGSLWSKETGNKSTRTMMILDNSKLVNQELLFQDGCRMNHVMESRLENNYYNFQPRLPWVLVSNNDVSYFNHDQDKQKSFSECVMGEHENPQAQCSTNNGTSCSFKAMKILQSNQTVQLPSNFVFNLPYLKTRLDQIDSSSEQYKLDLMRPNVFSRSFDL
jgi:hypothetical protein